MSASYRTQCKFCGRDIELRIDAAYAELGDPYKLLKLAACNHCADLRESRRTLEESLELVGVFLIRHQTNLAEGQLEAVREKLRLLLPEYLALIARWKKEPANPFHESIVEAIVLNPARWRQPINRLWNMPKP